MGQNNNNKEFDKSLSHRSKRHPDPPDYPLKFVDVKVCASLYNSWKSKKSLYRNTPEEGIPVKIEYADTLCSFDASGREIGSSSPTVLCLHGAPGSHRDFKYLIKHLQQTGYRVIAPNFPSEFQEAVSSFFTSISRTVCFYLLLLLYH